MLVHMRSFMMKLSSQHRALYCYLILSVWIFLLVAGMYKYIGSEEAISSSFKHTTNDIPTRNYQLGSKPNSKMRRIYRLCNAPEDIALGSEGQVKSGYSLEAALIFLRHGDRGPLAHVRNISAVNCAGDVFSADGADSDVGFRAYEYFVSNLSAAGRPPPSFLAAFLGPFHGFPLVPPSTGECQLGQLTPVGVAQLLKTGALLRAAYGDRLGIGNGTLGADDVAVFSTRYRRTVQSAVAFLYAFLSYDDFQKVALRESQSLAFCFDACACPAAERYHQRFSAESSAHLRSHPAVVALVSSASAVAFEVLDGATGPHALRDALLAYVCHAAPLPCADSACVRADQLTGLFAYTEWEARQYAKSGSLKRAGLLRAYGMLRDVVAHVLRVVSERRRKVVVYSGHDKTLQYLATALGLMSDLTAMPQYASRLVIEVYKSREQRAAASEPQGGPVARDYYFRLVFNGKDLTNRIHFCKGGNAIDVDRAAKNGPTDAGYGNASTSQSWAKKTASTYLCPIESIVRFLHDNYFQSFNATNFKDACALHT